MITIWYTGPCEWDPKQIGWAEIDIAYTGEYPVTTAERFMRMQEPRCRLALVVCNGKIYFDGRP